jgi:hypothetical protein
MSPATSRLRGFFVVTQGYSRIMSERQGTKSGKAKHEIRKGEARNPKSEGNSNDGRDCKFEDDQTAVLAAFGFASDSSFLRISSFEF